MDDRRRAMLFIYGFTLLFVLLALGLGFLLLDVVSELVFLGILAALLLVISFVFQRLARRFRGPS